MMKNFFIAFTVLCLLNNFSTATFSNVQSVKIGSMEVFSLVDARSEAPVSLLIGATDEQIAQYIPTGKLKSQILAFLVKTPDGNFLFDTGLGTAKGGKMSEALKDIGVSSSDIGTIFLTHLHPDHFGGLVDNGGAAFSNAEIYVSKIEKDWWLNEKKDENVKFALELYKDKLHTFNFGDTLLNLVTAIDTSGHTPGHTAFHIKRDDGELLVVGDILHFAEIMLSLPEIAVVYDVDPVKAPKARKFILDMAAEKNIAIAGMHFPVPGLWKINRAGNGYEAEALVK